MRDTVTRPKRFSLKRRTVRRNVTHLHIVINGVKEVSKVILFPFSHDLRRKDHFI